MRTVKGWLIDIFSLEKALGLPPEGDPKTGAIPPVPPQYPCPVRGCEEPVRIIEQSALYTTVFCDVYDAFTTYETTAREERTQQIIRVQDQWHQHGTNPPPKR